MRLLILFLIIHLIINLIFFIITIRGDLQNGRMLLSISLFVPIWGPICFLIQRYRYHANRLIGSEVGIEKLKINDEVYRSILMNEDDMEKRVVPLEEALIMNSTQDKRDLMLDIMYSNPEDYIGLLQEASSNDDTEVVHYAVTALVELQKKYDLMFQKLDAVLDNSPDDISTIDEYLRLQEKYLTSGLLTGEDFVRQSRDYSNLLEKRISLCDPEQNLYKKKSEIDLQLGEYDTAYRYLQKMQTLWPNEEDIYLLLLQYYAAIFNRAGIDQTLELIKFHQVHLSPYGRAQVNFWSPDSV